jgi:ABC-type multidrug transport system fused ATPase/permease subunit
VEKPLRISVNRVVVVVVMLFGAWQLLQGQITTSAFLLFMFFAQSLIGPLTGLASIFLTVTEIRALLSGVAYLLAVDEEPNGTRPARADDFQDRIELKDVSFAYGDLPVLRNANLTIRKGEMVALVGRSGAGKSTLVDLLMRFYLPTDGVITLDGVQVGEFNLQQYRRLFGVVSQDELLFNDTVYNNIAYARPELSREDVERSARIANAEPFILSDLDNGYDTIVGQRGVRLSGGQRQRIAIARAVAHQPAVLILDEATSSLDSESERLVQQAIEQVVKGCTAVVIAHRLSTVLMADKIVVLKEGEIVEMGTHQELLNRGGEYRYLYDLQFATDVLAHPPSFASS